MDKEIKEILDNPKILMLSYGDYISLDDYVKLKDYITELQEEIKEYDYLIDMQNQRKYHKKYLKERRKEQPNLLYPDFDEVYERYFKQKEKIDKATKKIERIIDYGFDYDGFNDEKDLKGLIDMLVDYADQALKILEKNVDK